MAPSKIPRKTEIKGTEICCNFLDITLLLIVSQPTRGLDVGAIEYIHKRLIEERDNGKAVLVVSFELDEILNVSDRIAVIHDGKIQGIVSPETTNKQELGVLMAGGNLGKEKRDV